jgi:hypothetical protein
MIKSKLFEHPFRMINGFNYYFCRLFGNFIINVTYLGR